MMWEADQRHAEILGTELGLTEGSNPLTVPGRELTKEELDQEERLMEGDSATAYRAMAARANFLAIDRPDIAFSVKEICRRMSAPDEGDLLALKRLGRYLQGAPRLVHRFDWQDNPGQITVMTDSDWAGCPRTRKSTTGDWCFAVLTSSSTGQPHR